MPPVSETHTWSVSQVNEWATLAIAQAFPDDLWIEGEICNLSRSARGHVYFNLIEAGEDRRSPTTSLSVTLFDWNRQKVNLHLRRAGGAVRMEDGVRVRIRGRIELYAAKAQVQFRMIAIDPAFTLGDLAAGRERILAALAAEGLLEANARLPRPVLPLRVGLVTSLGSAAHGDFLHEIELSGIGFDLVTVDARVQGVEADITVAAAIAELHRHGVALIALVRGGGARTDLAAFDSEVIARAIATSPLPVWSGIGHEVDRTIADEVCHRALKTPTACAAALIETVRADIASAEDAWAGIARRVVRRLDTAVVELDRTAQLTAAVTRTQLDQQAHRLERHGDRVRSHAGRVTDRADAALDRAARSIAPTARRHLDRAHGALGQQGHRLRAATPRQLERASRDVGGVEAQVRAYDPARTLARGWSLTRRADGSVLRSIGDARPGERIVTTVTDGTVHSTIDETSEVPTT